MAMMQWESFRGAASLRRAIDRVFEDLTLRSSTVWRELTGGDLRLDMYQTAKDVVVKVPLAGLSPEEVDISITENRLTVKGEYREEKGIEREDYLRKERRQGAFSRSVTVPVAVKGEKAEAVFDNGILTLTLPKIEIARPRQIRVTPQAAIEAPTVEKRRAARARAEGRK